MSDHEDELLSLLQSHGQNFLQSFSSTEPLLALQRNNFSSAQLVTAKIHLSDNEDEWNGIGNDTFSSDDGQELEFEQEDDGFTAESGSKSNVVVFSDLRPQISAESRYDQHSKAKMKAFMSSKASKIRVEPNAPSQQPVSEIEREDERTNAQNDSLLHKLVHTKLLSGSLETELDLTPAQRRKALAGRVLELTGSAKLGKGEKVVRQEERNKAAKRVREGMALRQQEREKQELEEAKNLGNYHPTLKKLYESSASAGSKPPRRDRGLNMGVGKYRGGFLHLSKDDIRRGEGSQPYRTSRGGRGGRGGRSRGRKRG